MTCLNHFILETDASGIGLGAALLQLCNNMVCQEGVAPQNIALHPIAFASKSLTGAERRYSKIKQEALGILTWVREIPPLLLWTRGAHYH